MTPLPADRIAELRKLMERATPEKWSTLPCSNGGKLLSRPGQVLQIVPGVDADLMAELRNDAAALIAAAEELGAREKHWVGLFSDMEKKRDEAVRQLAAAWRERDDFKQVAFLSTKERGQARAELAKRDEVIDGYQGETLAALAESAKLRERAKKADKEAEELEKCMGLCDHDGYLTEVRRIRAALTDPELVRDGEGENDATH